ncbi:hypothetical protein MKX08_003436 [Trichoderma sp. CBMAI-0020]|nr:hypothetical protein MKX08_003436 [Trichoderma sp. CBMAI-0020]WOD46459.1 hypothetical protein [Trichoderma atroviride]
MTPLCIHLPSIQFDSLLCQSSGWSIEAPLAGLRLTIRCGFWIRRMALAAQKTLLNWDVRWIQIYIEWCVHSSTWEVSANPQGLSKPAAFCQSGGIVQYHRAPSTAPTLLAALSPFQTFHALSSKRSSSKERLPFIPINDLRPTSSQAASFWSQNAQILMLSKP